MYDYPPSPYQPPPCSVGVSFRRSYHNATIHPKKLAEALRSQEIAGSERRNSLGLSPDVQELLMRVYPNGSAQANQGVWTSESFEAKQGQQLQELINLKKRSHDLAKSSPDSSSGKASPAKKRADEHAPYSFDMPIDDDTFTTTTTTAEPQRFMRKSADSINTRFVADDFSSFDGRFNGSPDRDPFLAAKKQARKDSRRGTQSPRASTLNMSQESTSDPQLGGKTQPESAFDPLHWTEKIGPEAFVPRPPPRHASSSPTKLNRPIRKAKPVRMTAGTAGLVDEDESSSSGEDKTRPGTATGQTSNTAPITTDSPVAMDIDTPPPEPSMPFAEPKVARNIPVEPSKPEWRAGNAAAVPAAHTKPPVAPPNSNLMGSEDSTDFLFSDFKNVAPFAPQPGGLGSFGDLKSSLPFESKAASQLVVEKEQFRPLPFPAAPKSPRAPPALAVPNLKPGQEAWNKYAQEFRRYMEQWADFNAQVIGHFAARTNMMNESKKSTGFSWVEARGDAGIRKYLQWFEEDKIVRQKWMAACDSHELRVKEFMKYKEKMLQ